jgi:predicted dehydrogenase
VADLRIGILGAARIAPMALVKPAVRVPGVVVAAVAARDPARAAGFARKHQIATVHSSYDELLADSSIDAVYNPLPNALHAEWTLKALAAGKHVLCEKPFTSNESEAREVATAASESGLVVMEAFHYRYHALAAQMQEIAHDGRLGEITSVQTWMCFPLPKFSDIRYSYSLGGGTTMDCCYAVHALRLVGPGEPSVVSAKPLLHGPDIDRAMDVTYSFAGGATGRSIASMWSRRLFRFSLRVTGTRGQMRVTNFIAPQYWNRLSVTVDGVKTHVRVRGEASYVAQLRAFVAAVRDGGPVLTPPEDAIITMRVIDDIYRAAGLPIRGLPWPGSEQKR